jgi:hypothetical protein
VAEWAPGQRAASIAAGAAEAVGHDDDRPGLLAAAGWQPLRAGRPDVRALCITLCDMCRNIRTLHNFEPRATDQEIREAAIQYVRKISGSTKPSQVNAEAFGRAVDEIALSTGKLLDELVTSAPPKDREIEAAKRRARAAERFAA